MSEIITPENMPNLLHEHEQRQWLEAKATRRDLEMLKMSMKQQFDQQLGANLKNIASTMSRIYAMARMNGLQVDTITRIVGAAVPDFEKTFEIELKKTMDLTQFLDTMTQGGGNADKTYKEKVELIRGWNSRDDVLKAEGSHFGLEEYVLAHPDEFTAEEIEALNKDFKAAIPVVQKPPVVLVPEVVDAGGNNGSQEPVSIPTTVVQEK